MMSIFIVTLSIFNTAIAVLGAPSKKPQLVSFQFSDLVDRVSCNQYLSLFGAGRKNSNGCPIKASFFMSKMKYRQETDFNCIKDLYEAGHEIGAHTIHHSSGGWWYTASYDDWVQEMAYMKTMLHQHAGVPLSEIRGLMVPQLRFKYIPWNGIQMMADYGFEYDTTLVRDYKSSDIYDLCQDQDQCVKNGISNMMELPLIIMKSQSGIKCILLEQCYNIHDSVDNILNHLKYLFERHYNYDRKPLRFITDKIILSTSTSMKALDAFIEYLVSLDDVYIVSAYETLQWRKDQDQNGQWKEPACEAIKTK